MIVQLPEAYEEARASGLFLRFCLGAVASVLLRAFRLTSTRTHTHEGATLLSVKLAAKATHAGFPCALLCGYIVTMYVAVSLACGSFVYV